MKRNTASFVGFVAGLVGLLTAGWLLASPRVGQSENVGMPTDWSHRHLIFSKPANAEELTRASQDPRYWQQWSRLNISRELSQQAKGALESSPLTQSGKAGSKMGRDWSQNLGSGGTVGAGNFPAKYSFQITSANCGNTTSSDYVVFSTGLSGSSTQASIIAYDNLYSGCTGNVPTVAWAYNTGGQVLTSPVLSFDGKQVAFVQTSGSAGSLVLVRWAISGGTASAPVSPTSVVAASYHTCTAPCMTTVSLKNGAGVAVNDTTSSVFPDYTNDVIWVGGASGWLHKITGAFRGTPAEVTTGGFPVQVNTSTPTSLSSPIYDSASKNVFVGDLGGFLYRVSSAGAVTATARLDFGTGLVASPVVDSTAGKVYAFSSSDGTSNCTGGLACAAIYVFPVSFSSAATGTEAQVGVSSATPNSLYLPGFDSLYLSSSSATGNIYICGATGTAPTLYRVPIAAGSFGTVAQVAILTPVTSHPACSPVTDIANPNAAGGSTEHVFFGAQNNAHPTLCSSGGCAMSYVTTPWTASTAYTAGQEVLVYNTSNHNLYINVATNSGTTGTTAPTWPSVLGTITADGGVNWINQGPSTVTPLSGWLASHRYASGSYIIDSNGNVEISTSGTARSGTSAPAWNTTVNGDTTDGGVVWVNAGAWPSTGLPAAGGTSGFVIDNVVGSGTLAGASQVYFSTLSNQACGSGGTGGCAVQASQSALQ